MQAVQENLVRKQIMLSVDNVKKLECIAKKRGTSVAEVVRSAVDSYDPSVPDVSDSELFELVFERLQDVIEDTAMTRKRLSQTLNKLAVTSVES